MRIPPPPESFEIIALSPCGQPDPSVPIAAARTGATGLLDLTLIDDRACVAAAVGRLMRAAPERTGLIIDGWGDTEAAALAVVDRISIAVIDPPYEDPAGAVERWRRVAGRVGLVARCGDDAGVARELGLDFVVAKGHEAGGRVSAETTFVLLQRLLAELDLPVYAWGGIGPHSAAACRAGGAAGVILDWQLSLLRESPLPPEFQRRIAAMDGSETVLVAGPAGSAFRLYDQPGMTAREKLEALSEADVPLEEWSRAVRELVAHPSSRERLWPVSQDASMASRFAADAPSVARVLGRMRDHVESAVRGAAESRALAENGPLAVSHGTSFPVVQGPMTHVSDVPEFCAVVESEGALPFMALALMRQNDVRRLLHETRERMGTRPWGVGLLGFSDPEIRAAQVAAIKEARPGFAIIAGGRPDQARALEARGVATYLHVPSPTLLRLFLSEGVRRFVFEGSECGGHVGPRTSFVLWDAMIHTLLDSELSVAEMRELHVVFAGGIHDARSSAMVAAMAQPLVERGAKLGILMGTAYLFTKEIVAAGAVVEGFQQAALAAESTALIETGPGHAIRCVPTEYVHRFDSEKTRLLASAEPREVVRKRLERMQVGRLRIASKGIARASDSRGDTGTYVSVEGDAQRRDGVFMIGQIAALRCEPWTMRDLHEDVCSGSIRLLDAFRENPAVTVKEPEQAPPPFDVAIIGLGCLLPGAGDATTFWQRILAKHDAITEIPPDRFDAARWFDEDRSARDKICSRWGGFLDDVPFDPLRYGIPPASIPSIEPMQLLALEVVDQALRDAGYLRDNPHRARTSVIFGAGGGLAELGASYTVRAMLPQYLESPDEALYAQLPEWTEDSFAGILLNVVAGRVSNRFDLGGVNYTVDAACASSLAAVRLACRELVDGTSDLVIAGGADTVQNPLSYLGFSKAGALSPRGRSRAFDAGADGIVISEGLAAIVLKRRKDAERDGDRIYAIVRAIAGGSDGREKTLTQPSVEGQKRTLQRAYAQARRSPASIGLFEAHGTGTALGDPTESRALRALLDEHGAPPGSAAIGSVKSMIGHTKATAGIAGLLKATLALHHRVLPATLHVDAPNPRAGLEDGPLCVNTETRPWIRGDSPRGAGVSSFGFGGTNFHAVLEEYEDASAPRPVDSPRRHRRAELFAFYGGDGESLAKRIRSFARQARSAHAARADLDLARLAYTLHRSHPLAPGSCCATVVSFGIEELTGQLDWLAAEVDPQAAPAGRRPPGVYTEPEVPGRDTPIAFLFPGQGSQHVNMLRDLAIEFGEVRVAFERADRALGGCCGRPLSRFVFPPPAFAPEDRARAEEALKRTNIAQPALGACGVGVLRLLEAFGVRPGMTAGHSYGELVALHASGALEEEDLYRLSWERGESMLEITRGRDGHDLGGMLAVRADPATTTRVLKSIDEVWLANLNAPRQTIVSGTHPGLEAAARAFKTAGIATATLAAGCGFHSPLVAHARDRFDKALERIELPSPTIPVYNNSTAARYPQEADAIRGLLSENLVRRVCFADEIEAMYTDGARVFVEVGPGGVLSNLVEEILGDRPHRAVAMQARGPDGVVALLHGLAALIASGVDVQAERLYEGRSLEKLDLLSASSPEPELPAHVWLVNGSYARPATEPPRRLEPIRSEAPAPPPAQEGRPIAPLAAEPIHAEPVPPYQLASEPLAQFQETMRCFLETQEAVLRSFLGGSPETARPQPKPVLASLSPEHGERPAPAPASRPEAAEVPTVPQSPPASDDLSLEERLVALVSERTGYPVDMLDPEANLEADLGIDSIKRVEIIAAIRRSAVPGIETPPEWFMERMTGALTLREICDGIEQLRSSANGSTGSAEVPASIEPVPGPAATSASNGCPRSIACVEEVPLDGQHSTLPDGVVVMTADGRGAAAALARHIEAAGGRSVTLDDAALVSRAAAESALASVRREHGRIGALLHLLPLREAPSFPGIEPSVWAEHLDAELKSALFLLQALEPELSNGHGAPLRVATAAIGGSSFGQPGDGEATRPWRAGLAGLLKSAAHEWKGAHFRALDLDRLPEPSLLLDELLAEGSSVHVGYRGGRRLLMTTRRSELRPAPDQPAVPLGPDSVVLVTGGARGITAEVVQEVAQRTRATCILLGRSAPPVAEEDSATADAADPVQLRGRVASRLNAREGPVSPRQVEAEVQRILAAREIRRTLAALREAGAIAEYIPCDVRDRAALEAVVRDVQKRYGGIDALIHGAGVIEDRYLIGKTAESLDRVIGTKVDPVLTLVDALDPERLKLFMFFSSVAGFFGNPGQGDYAAANEMLNSMASRLQSLWPGKVVALNWGPWTGAGMVSPEVARQFESRGVGLVPVADGRRLAWAEFVHPADADVRVIVGDGAWVESGERP